MARGVRRQRWHAAYDDNDGRAVYDHNDGRAVYDHNDGRAVYDDNGGARRATPTTAARVRRQ